MKIRAIATEAGMHFSTVSRELRRNSVDGDYDPVVAHQLSNIEPTPVLWGEMNL